VVTAPAPGTAKPTRVWVLGDPGTGSSAQTAVRDAYYNFTGSRYTDLWLMLGDNAYSSGTDSEFQSKLFNVYAAMLRKSVLFPTRGNHESASSGGNVVYYNVFTMPRAGESGGVASGSEAYYSFDYGNIHFICLARARPPARSAPRRSPRARPGSSPSARCGSTSTTATTRPPW
jgi:acid phosphatase type 7